VIKSHGGERQGQMRSGKMNASEPLNKRRNQISRCQNQGIDENPGISAAGACLWAARHPA
jgi:hypothetical protein